MASFDATTCELKIKIAIVNADGVVATREANEFPRFCKMFNLDAEDLGRTFDSRGRGFTVTGIKPNNSKFPIIGTRDDGKSFKFPQAMVVRALHPDRDPDGSFGRLKDGTAGRDIETKAFEPRS